MAYKIWMNAQNGTVNLDYMEKALLEAGYDFRMRYVENRDQERILALGKWADAVISGLEIWNPERLMVVRDSLRFLLRFGTGVDNIDIPFATSLGIVVANIPGANASAVAEAALLHILNLGRRLTQECYMPGRPWTEAGIGTELDGKSVGIIGFGNIGKHLARMLRGFDVRIYAYDPFARIDEAAYCVKAVSDYTEIFRICDFVSLHVPVTPQTQGLINTHTLEMMKKTAYLINTSRGGVVNEEDLFKALKAGTIAGAGLDVLNAEPGEQGSPLLGLKNAVVSAHIGGRTEESVHRSQIMLVNAVNDFFAGKVPFHTINPEALAGSPQTCKQKR